MRKYSEGTVRRNHRKDGTWKWEAVIAWTEDGKRGTLRKVTPYTCAPGKDNGKRGVQEKPKGTNSKQALTFLREWRDELIAAQEAEAAAQETEGMRVLELVDKYWASRDIEPVTRDGYAKLRKHLDVSELDRVAADLKPLDVQAWLDAEAERGVSVQLRKKTLTQLKSAYKWAVRMQILTSNPCDPIDAPRVQKNEPNPLDRDELNRMLEALEPFSETSEEHRCVADLARLAVHTGMRIGELCGLTWDAVDGGVDGTLAPRGKLHVRTTVSVPTGGAYLKPYPKNRKYRDITLNQETVDVLIARRKLFEPFVDDLHGCYVLACPSNPTQFAHPYSLSRIWSTFVATIGLTGVEGRPPRMHDLRDTFASQALSAGKEPLNVSQTLGHSDVQTTLRYYAHYLPSAEESFMLSMGKVIAGTSTDDDDGNDDGDDES